MSGIQPPRHTHAGKCHHKHAAPTALERLSDREDCARYSACRNLAAIKNAASCGCAGCNRFKLAKPAVPDLTRSNWSIESGKRVA
jgi:hypothetical protein